MSAEAAFQAAVLDRLRADAGVQSVFGDPARVYAGAPRGAAFPYVVLGAGESTPADAQGARLIDHKLTLAVRARRLDLAAAKQAVGLVRDALHLADLPLAGGARCVLCRVVYTDVVRAGDARSLTGLVRLNARLDRT